MKYAWQFNDLMKTSAGYIMATQSKASSRLQKVWTSM